MVKVSFSHVRKTVGLIFLVSFSMAFGYAVGLKGYQVGSSGNGRVSITREVPVDKSNLDFSLFWQVWDRLNASYFDKSKLVPRNMVYGAIKGMVEAVGDPYTVFLPPSENKVIQEDLGGEFEGVGIQIGFRGSRLVVVAPLAKTPAEEAGIKAGDEILAITDKRKGIDKGTVGMTLPEAVQAIRGPAGSKVTLTMLREGEQEPRIFEVARRSILVPSVTAEYVGDNKEIALIKLSRFGKETEKEWDKVVNEVAAKGNLEGIILDLRNNPGGYLDGSVYIASEFLSSGAVVYQQGSNGEKLELPVKSGGKLENETLVVLVNKGSASASEIVAGALKDQKRGSIVGDTTFGKGTIQEPQEFPGGAGLHITIAKWLTPTGNWINEKGLEPDVKIEDDLETEKDEQLEKAISEIQKS